MTQFKTSTQLHAMSMLLSISAFQRLGSWGLLKHNYAPVAMRVLVTTSSLGKCLNDSLQHAAPFAACWKEQWHCHMWQILLVSDGNWLPSDAYFHSFKKFRWYFHQVQILYLFDLFSLLRLSLRQDQTARMAPGRSCRCQQRGNWGLLNFPWAWKKRFKDIY